MEVNLKCPTVTRSVLFNNDLPLVSCRRSLVGIIKLTVKSSLVRIINVLHTHTHILKRLSRYVVRSATSAGNPSVKRARVQPDEGKKKKKKFLISLKMKTRRVQTRKNHSRLLQFKCFWKSLLLVLMCEEEYLIMFSLTKKKKKRDRKMQLRRVEASDLK